MIKLFLILLSSNIYAQNLCLEDDKNCMLEKSSKKLAIDKRVNILGGKLSICSKSPITGFFRDGSCMSNKEDFGNHSICAKVTNSFLQYSLKQGNNLITPAPRYNFPGLKDGDYWCLCAARYEQAYQAGIKLEIKKDATHTRSFNVINRKVLIKDR